MLSHRAVSDMSVHAPITDMPARTGLVEKRVSRVSEATSEFCPSLLGIPPRSCALISPAHFENARDLRTLAGKIRIIANVSHFLARESNKAQKTTSAISDG
jgi:hypothetical protein